MDTASNVTSIAKVKDDLTAILIKQLENSSFAKTLSLYIPSCCKLSFSDEKNLDLTRKVYDFLTSDNKVLLLMGDSGSGKSLFGQWLATKMLQINTHNAIIPLFIPLPIINDRSLEQYIEESYDITPQAIEELKSKYQFLFILDAYDETKFIKQQANLYEKYKLANWRGKVIFTCRSQALANIKSYQNLFIAENEQSIEELIINPFTNQQINAYIKKYIELNKKRLDELAFDNEYYEKNIINIPSLMELISSPFILSIVIEYLPNIIAKYKYKQEHHKYFLARIDIYDTFMEQWFKRQEEKLLHQIPELLKNINIKEKFTEYSKRLASRMLSEGVFSIKEPHVTNIWQNCDVNNSIWEEFFSDEENRLLPYIRKGCPLIKISKNEYSFLHKSLLEYFAARELFEGAVTQASIATGKQLNDKLLNDDPETIEFIANQVTEDEQLKLALLNLIHESKHEARIAVAAANAMTILVNAEVSFSGMDLSRAKLCHRDRVGKIVGGANLEGIVAENTNFSGADLGGASLREAWLKNANFANTCLDEVDFGELPTINVDHQLYAIQSSPKEKWLAAGATRGYIYLFDGKNRNLVNTLRINLSAHEKKQIETNREGVSGDVIISVLAFSADEKFLAVGGYSLTSIRIFDLASGKICKEFKVSKDSISKLIFSPDNSLLAAEDSKNIVFVWELNSKNKSHSMSFTDLGLLSFNPESTFLALSSKVIEDKNKKRYIFLYKRDHKNKPMFRLAEKLDSSQITDQSKFWGKISLVVNDDGDKVTIIEGDKITFSLDKKFTAVGGEDGQVRVFSTETGDVVKSFIGHTAEVWGTYFIQKGEFLASASHDKTIRFWSTNFDNVKAFMLHNREITQIVINPNNTLFASTAGGHDSKIILWDLKSGKRIRVLANHFSSLAMFTSDGTKFISIELTRKKAANPIFDTITRSVKVWDVITGELIKVWDKKAETMDISPNGQFIAFVLKGLGKNNTIEIWDKNLENLIKTLPYSTEGVKKLKFSPDSQLLIIGNCHKNFVVYDTSQWEIANVLHSNHDVRYSAELTFNFIFQNDEYKLFSYDAEKIQIWDLANSEPMKTFKIKNKVIAFSPDGKFFAHPEDNNELKITELATGKCILKLSGYKAPVSVIAWDKQNNIIAGSWDMSIKLWEVYTEDLQLKAQLRYNKAQFKSLNIDRANISGGLGLSTANVNLLLQHESVGKASKKSLQNIIKVRNAPIKIESYALSVLVSNKLITEEKWIVALARKKGTEHAFLMLEGAVNGYLLYKRIDLFIDLKQPRKFFGKSGKALIEIEDKVKYDICELIKQCEYKFWEITIDQGLTLIDNIEEHRKTDIAYLEMGDSKFWNLIDANKERHSCITWCELHLTKIGIALAEQKRWVDGFITITSQHIPSKSKSNETLNSQKRPIIKTKMNLDTFDFSIISPQFVITEQIWCLTLIKGIKSWFLLLEGGEDNYRLFKKIELDLYSTTKAQNINIIDISKQEVQEIACNNATYETWGIAKSDGHDLIQNILTMSIPPQLGFFASHDKENSIAYKWCKFHLEKLGLKIMNNDVKLEETNIEKDSIEKDENNEPTSKNCKIM